MFIFIQNQLLTKIDFCNKKKKNNNNNHNTCHFYIIFYICYNFQNILDIFKLFTDIYLKHYFFVDKINKLINVDKILKLYSYK